MISPKISFDNTEIAFKGKSSKDLERAYWLFKIISSNFLTNVGPPITNFALNVGLPITGLIKATIFKQFCGGETIAGCTPAIQQLGKSAVGTILDYSVEGEDTEEVFDATFQEVLRTVEAAKNNPYIPFSVFKPTGLGKFELFEKVNAKEPLTDAEQAAYQRMLDRTDRICRACYEAGVKVLVDAEHSWIQDAIDDIARDMMQRYNLKQPIVYNTYQLYRHDKLASLKADFAYAQEVGFFLGAKIVRGAYMEIERARALEKGYKSPIQPTKEATDADYNEAIKFCVTHIDHIGFMAGTHNEASSKLVIDEMVKAGVEANNDHVYFAQLLGMSDNLSFNLGEAGFNVAKYMPYGPVKAVMPYLFRRAQENTSVAGQTGRELSLIIKEKNRRKNS
ncbi:proline dehydrogenase family protein [Sphingobacteriaceae bacterium WQ 2009]|uniref:Proline dehydrogenase family protein n=1 Tax=Rhinopithecimicrobium faecis TaxID=2820698 RepID=A0A8T4H770_9SPHI|nr:proline dehydrogenase family protein [Sphingobacteriaceae bacterium WQ 2009]